MVRTESTPAPVRRDLPCQPIVGVNRITSPKHPYDGSNHCSNRRHMEPRVDVDFIGITNVILLDVAGKASRQLPPRLPELGWRQERC